LDEGESFACLMGKVNLFGRKKGGNSSNEYYESDMHIGKEE